MIEILEFKTKLFFQYIQTLKVEDMEKRNPEQRSRINRQLELVQNVVEKRYLFPNIPYGEATQKNMNRSLRMLICHKESV